MVKQANTSAPQVTRLRKIWIRSRYGARRARAWAAARRLLGPLSVRTRPVQVVVHICEELCPLVPRHGLELLEADVLLPRLQPDVHGGAAGVREGGDGCSVDGDGRERLLRGEGSGGGCRGVRREEPEQRRKVCKTVCQSAQVAARSGLSCARAEVVCDFSSLAAGMERSTMRTDDLTGDGAGAGRFCPAVGAAEKSFPGPLLAESAIMRCRSAAQTVSFFLLMSIARCSSWDKCGRRGLSAGGRAGEPARKRVEALCSLPAAHERLPLQQVVHTGTPRAANAGPRASSSNASTSP